MKQSGSEGPWWGKKKKKEEEGEEKKKTGLTRRKVFGMVLAVASIPGWVSIGEYLLRKRELVLHMLQENPNHESDEAVQEAVSYIREAYGVEIHFGDSFDPGFTAGELTLEEARDALTRLIQALDRVPPELLRDNQITNIRLCKDPTLVSTWVEAFRREQVGGYFDGTTRGIIIGYYEGDFYTLAIYHELYHQLDRTLHPDAATREEEDKLWNELLGEYAVSEYGATNPGEGRAEVAARIIDPMSYALLESELNTPGNEARAAALRRGIAHIQKRLEEMSGGRMNAEFWAATLAEGQRLLAEAQREEPGYEEQRREENVQEQTEYYDLYEYYSPTDSYTYEPPVGPEERPTPDLTEDQPPVQ